MRQRINGIDSDVGISHRSARHDTPPGPPTKGAGAMTQQAVPHVWTIEEGLAAGAECQAAALHYRRQFNWSVTCCCPPDHVGVARVSRKHGRKCKSPGKRPWHTWAEYQNRLPTEDEINRWWDQLPNSNVGAILGEISGIIRVDAEGERGRARLRELCGGELPVTPTFESGSGGGNCGLIFAVPAGVELQTRSEPFTVGDHDELRLQGRGSQTVLPPSRHVSGGRYRWLPGLSPDDIPIAPMPDRMVEIMRVRERAKRLANGRATRETDPADVALALAALEGLSKDRAGNYDDWLHVGMALHSVDDGDATLEAWDKWSHSSEELYEEGACAEKWETFTRDRENGITLGSLLHWAQQDGWVRPLGPKIVRGHQHFGTNGDGRHADESAAPAAKEASPATPARQPPPGDPADDCSSDPVHCTDLGNAIRMWQQHGRDLHHEHRWKVWLVWDGCRWAADDLAHAKVRAKRTVTAMFREARIQVQAIEKQLEAMEEVE
jgi:hypothetical protein